LNSVTQNRPIIATVCSEVRRVPPIITTNEVTHNPIFVRRGSLAVTNSSITTEAMTETATSIDPKSGAHKKEGRSSVR
jgi:hypothetical protein